MTAFTRARLLLLGCLALAAPALADTQVSAAWVRAAVPGQSATGAFMVLTADRDARLVAARSPLAREVQIHQMRREGEVLRMQPVASLSLPARQPVSLDPHGYHLMLMGLTGELAAGAKVPLQLVVEDAQGQRQELAVDAPVRPLETLDSPHAGH